MAAMANIWGISFSNLKNIGWFSDVGEKKLPVMGASKINYFPTVPFGLGPWFGP